MDPKQTLTDAREALLIGSRTATRVALGNYWAWRHKGGFEPILRVLWAGAGAHIVNGDEYARTIANNIGRKPADYPALVTEPILR